MKRFVEILARHGRVDNVRIPIQNSAQELNDMIESRHGNIIGSILKIKDIGILEIKNITIGHEFVFICKIIILG